jgi:NADH:ubiquinone oxidoreductase subunit 5 (subunit L)/multisubunit Na+/H+ antiporter MnhA subunit
MLAISILYGSVLCALFAPLVVAALVGSMFFFKADLFTFEKATYRVVRFSSVFSLLASFLAFSTWYFTHLKYGAFGLSTFHIGGHVEISPRLFFGFRSVAFLLSSTTINGVITFFSHRYLHRDPGYRRFFITISLFSFGINLIILAGTFDLIFAGWELAGLSSFLLIGYFWHRPKAVAAATRAYYIYRVCDLGLLASILITHFFWHNLNIFNDINTINVDSVLSHVPTSWRWLLSLCILIPVLGKSAQFPFCFWLPKAMEGPTHSSAIFYGSLSIHVGVFLLIRTMPVWYSTPGFTYLLGGIGIITALSCTVCAQVQSNIKGQIGYASIAQVGLILVELAFGLVTLAFFHMVGNAFLRCFQLLVSSSILTTHLHLQNVVRTFGGLSRFSPMGFMPKRLKPTLYVFALNDGYFEVLLKKLFVLPVMWFARLSNNLMHGRFPWRKNLTSSERKMDREPGTAVYSFAPLLFALCFGVFLDVIFRGYEIVRLFSLIAALILALAALGEQSRALRALILAIFGNLFAFLSVTGSRAGLLYLIGLITSAAVAIEALRYIEKRRRIFDLNSYLGLYQQFPLAGTMLLLGSLGILCFPISSTFYGEDLLLSLGIKSGLHYLIIFQLIFIVSGVAVIRMYSRIMLGRRDNAMKEIPLDFSSFSMALRLVLFFGGNIAAFVLAS